MIAYFDCLSGISGDMTLGALIDAGADPQVIQSALQSLGLPEIRLVAEQVQRRGFRATHIRIEHPPEHAHRHLHHITAMLDRASLPPRADRLARDIFQRLAEAEAGVHGTTIEKVHFHEVGAIDSIGDIVGTAVALDLLDVTEVYASTVTAGHGDVEIAHGRVAVPAPATAALLRGFSVAAGTVESELTTPTGAAILAATCRGCGPMPPMRIETLGYGAGTKDFAQQANVLRLTLGVEQSSGAGGDLECDAVWELRTVVDDSTAEEIADCANVLRSAGALEVYLVAAQMKKDRMGTEITVLCDDRSLETCRTLLFQRLSTIGMRYARVDRWKLPRASCAVQTPFGTIAGKCAWLPDGRCRFTAEYDSVHKAAMQHDVAARDVYQAAQYAFSQTEPPARPA